jgi:hypothetical protein
MLLLTLLFLSAVGLRRTYDLRGYSGDALGVLTGRKRAYGYAHVERFLSQLAHAGGAETFTHALGRWTARVFQSKVNEEPATDSSPCFYVDGHRKPVYTEQLIPRGLIGRTGKILGCRALVLVHDDQGHPLQVSTHRGDQHLTMGLAQLLPPASQSTGPPSQGCVVLDREGMAAPFLRELQAQGLTVITLLRTDQYEGLESFSEVGQFVPFEQDRHGRVLREVAPACFALPLPDQAGQFLSLRVALIRDLRRQVRAHTPEEEEGEARWMRWRDDWIAQPSPATPTAAKLVPIVTTAPCVDAIELAQTYIRRWPNTALLDILKETALRTGFPDLLTSAASRERLPRDVLHRRLILCLYGLGTNTGFKRLPRADPGTTDSDLRYARSRYIHKEQLRNAIAHVANAIFEIRRAEIWGEGTTACASDSKKFGAWNQNLLTEWHIRYRGPGIMIYWHVEKKSTCIYSQLKSCSSSEAVCKALRRQMRGDKADEGAC